MLPVCGSPRVQPVKAVRRSLHFSDTASVATASRPDSGASRAWHTSTVLAALILLVLAACGLRTLAHPATATQRHLPTADASVGLAEHQSDLKSALLTLQLARASEVERRRMQGRLVNTTAKRVNRITHVQVKGGALIPGFGHVQPQAQVPCAPFRRKGVKRIVVVGNGPLQDADHGQIQHADLVVRFNMLNNRWPGEAMHVWFLRHRQAGLFHYDLDRLNTSAIYDALGLPPLADVSMQLDSHDSGGGSHPPHDQGIAQVKVHAAIERTMLVSTDSSSSAAGRPGASRNVTLVFLGGDPRNMATIARNFPAITPTQLQLVATGPLRADYRKKVGGPGSDPSTGFYGVQAILGCALKGVEVNLYGFNWAGRNTSVHNLQAEQALIQRWQQEGKLTVHPTLCQHQYVCNGTAAARL